MRGKRYIPFSPRSLGLNKIKEGWRWKKCFPSSSVFFVRCGLEEEPAELQTEDTVGKEQSAYGDSERDDKGRPQHNPPRAIESRFPCFSLVLFRAGSLTVLSSEEALSEDETILYLMFPSHPLCPPPRLQFTLERVPELVLL